MVRKNAAMCIREIAKHTPELAKLIVNSGGAAALVDYVTEAQGNNKLPGIMAIGYIAAFSETLALATIVSKAIPPLKEALISEPEDHIKAACVWTIGQIGRHTPDHARAIAEGDVLRHLLACMVHEDSSEDLKTKSKRALKGILAKCTHLQALQPLLRDSPVKVQKYVLRQFAQLLPHDVAARRAFVQVSHFHLILRLSHLDRAAVFNSYKNLTKLWVASLANSSLRLIIVILQKSSNSTAQTIPRHCYKRSTSSSQVGKMYLSPIFLSPLFLL